MKKHLATGFVLGFLASSVATSTAIFRSGSGQAFDASGAPSSDVLIGGFPGPAIVVTSYTGLEAVGFGSFGALDPDAASSGVNLVDLSFDSPVSLQFAEAPFSQATNQSEGGNFTFTPTTAVTSLTFTLSTSGWGAAFNTPSPNYTLGLNSGATSVATGDPNATGLARAAFDFSVGTNANSGNVASATFRGTSVGGGFVNLNNTSFTAAGPDNMGFTNSTTGDSSLTQMNEATGGGVTFTAPATGELGFALTDAPGTAATDQNLAITDYVVTLQAAPGQTLQGVEFRLSFDGAPVVGAVPEPSSVLLGSLALGALGLRRRR